MAVSISKLRAIGFSDKQIVDLHVVEGEEAEAFEKERLAYQRERHRINQRKYRSRKNRKSSNINGRVTEVTGHAGHTVSNTDLFSNVATTLASRKVGQRRELTSLPQGWLPDDHHHPEWIHFCDYAKQHDRRYADWEAAWRNWKRSPYQHKGANGNGRGRSILEAADRIDGLFRQQGGHDGYVPGSGGPRPLDLDKPKGAHGVRRLPPR